MSRPWLLAIGLSKNKQPQHGLALMKKFLFAVMLLIGVLSYNCNAQITVISPNGGERLPKNGQMIFWWSNSVPLTVSECLDQYDANGVYIQTYSMIGKGYAIAGLDYAYNLNDIDTTKLPEGAYKLRVSGQTSDGQVFTDQSDKFFYITRDASMTCATVDNNDWVQGKMKAFTISWDGFAVGDPYSVYLLLWDDYLGETYSFTLKSGTIESETGSITFNALFPTEAMSSYPEYPSIPVDAEFYAMFINGHNYLRTNSYPISVITKEVRVQVFEQKDFQSEVLKPMVPLSIVVDARYAHDNVQSLTIPIVGASSVSNAEFLCALYDKGRQVSEAHLIRMTDKGGYGYAEFTTHGLVVQKGSKIGLELHCIPLRGVGLCQFGLNRDGALTVIGRRHEEISSTMRGRWGPLVTITNRVSRLPARFSPW